MLVRDGAVDLEWWRMAELAEFDPATDPAWSSLSPPSQRMRDVLGGCDLTRAVITGCAGGPVGFAGAPVSMLSVNPPLMSVNPARTSLTWAQIRRTGRFCVNVLSAEQDACYARFTRLALDRFDGVLWTTSPGGCPVLIGATAWVECQVRAEHDGGDHRIVVGDVLALARDTAQLPPPFLRSSYGD